MQIPSGARDGSESSSGARTGAEHGAGWIPSLGNSSGSTVHPCKGDDAWEGDWGLTAAPGSAWRRDLRRVILKNTLVFALAKEGGVKLRHRGERRRRKRGKE